MDVGSEKMTRMGRHVGDDGDNGVVDVSGCCNGNVDGIAGGWDGGAVGLGDVGGIVGQWVKVMVWLGQMVQQRLLLGLGLATVYINKSQHKYQRFSIGLAAAVVA